MCFTPAVSLATALLEAILALILIVFFKRSAVRNFFAVLIVVLGTYQFTQFMLCITDYEIVWAKLGFIAYSFLPAIGLHAALSIYKKRSSIFFIYAMPVIATIYSLAQANFIQNAVCTSYFVEVLFTQRQSLASLIYMGYYFGFIAVMFVVAFLSYYKEHSPNKRKRDYAILLSIILMMLPTFILTVIFPVLEYRFPSVLCGFAVFTAIFSFIAAYYDQKDRTKEP